MTDEMLRRFARDQWVRVHGTPRITVLADDGERARRMWRQWLEVGELRGELYEGKMDEIVREAAAKAAAEPARPVAIVVKPAELAAWRRGRSDRLAAMVDEGIVEVGERPEVSASATAATGTTTGAMAGATAAGAGATAAAAAAATAAAVGAAAATTTAASEAALFDARSAAEVAMYEALEATPATAGRFELNGYLSVHFGAGAAEVDLLSRRDRIAIEIDGYHHFVDIEAYRRDRKKDLLLQLQDLIVIRLHAQDVMRDPRPGVTAVCQALAYRKERRP